MTRSRLHGAATIAGPLLLALVVYQPWRGLPLDVWDFQEFLPILASHEGIVARFTELVSYYASHGRMNVLFYASIVLQHELFGIRALGWQVARFGVMAGNLVLLHLVIRRLGLTRRASAAALVLFVIATPAVRAWLQLMAEPLVVTLLLTGMLAAIDYSTSEEWRRRAAVILAVIAMIFLTKEVDGVLGAVLVLVAIVAPWRAGAPIQWRARRNVVLATGAAAIAAMVLIALLLVRAMPAATGYGMAYGSGTISLARLGELAGASIMPVRPAAGIMAGLVYPVNLLAGALAVVAATLAHRRGAGRLGVVIAAGLTPAFVGAIAYLPWEKFDTFYALPFFLGALLLVAAAVDEVDRIARWGAALSMVVIMVFAVYGALPAQRSTEAAAASLRLNEFLAHTLGRFNPTDTVVVLGPLSGPRALPVKPEELRNYAVALGHVTAAQAPVVVASECDAYHPDRPVVGTHLAYASYSYSCGRFPQPVLSIASPYIWRDWKTLRAVADSLSLDFAGPAAARLLGQ